MRKFYLFGLLLISSMASAQMQGVPPYSPIIPMNLPVVHYKDTVSFDTYLTYRRPNVVGGNGQITQSDTSKPAEYFIEFASWQHVSGQPRLFRPSFKLELLDQHGRVVYSASFYRYQYEMVYDKRNPGYTFYAIPTTRIPLIAFNYCYALRISDN